jgi:hypothetical protein
MKTPLQKIQSIFGPFAAAGLFCRRFVTQFFKNFYIEALYVYIYKEINEVLAEVLRLKKIGSPKYQICQLQKKIGFSNVAICGFAIWYCQRWAV